MAILVNLKSTDLIVLDTNVHTITLTAPGPQGPQAPNVEIQYSEDAANWHDIASTNDHYFRFSTDGGVTWSEPLWFCSTAEAKGYMEDAATSASNAATSETNALASENKAEQWAENPEDVEVETGEYSAYHWAQKAASFAPLIEDQIVDGVTTKTASQNAIYDALVMLERKVGGGILI